MTLPDTRRRPAGSLATPAVHAHRRPDRSRRSRRCHRPRRESGLRWRHGPGRAGVRVRCGFLFELSEELIERPGRRAHRLDRDPRPVTVPGPYWPSGIEEPWTSNVYCPVKLCPSSATSKEARMMNLEFVPSSSVNTDTMVRSAVESPVGLQVPALVSAGVSSPPALTET